ncbi:DUF1697 domain-containing protein [Erysipelothrix rhusiopathiae]|nr:DUF1697 domain-containing protein [Erysipelothrix rhusiopathiae]MDE8064623.1 DUF1697 domain-containing protein [Erysipelothrix rhusiopathiae]MDE8079926.1 DUF1697 domain-containing protein [Erysipelothrix rhusiopathiae]MDE8084926.1 DUF1697 domain-containing protein [Erysipelothrix rhusiopathiae]MDE8088476.1 DUF1697 domain-containing protein [Erysipelothrix rhusiopathiae]
MKTYIALLRGINVGGKHKVQMADLKQIFESLGYTSVKTYINSGNVIFKSENEALKSMQEALEGTLKDFFQFEIPLVIITLEHLEQVLNEAPAWWDKTNKAYYHTAIFVIPPAKLDDIIEVMGEAHVEFESVQSGLDVIYWSADLQNYSKSRWSKTASTSINNCVTLRTANTVYKLLELSQKLKD